MADCSGKWIDSTINWERKNGQIKIPPLKLDDGEFEIHPHPGSAVFTGNHKDPQGNQTQVTKTQCADNGPNQFKFVMHRLDLTKTPPENFIYTGDGTIDPVTRAGKIKGRVRVTGGPPDPGDTGTWEASRPGGGGEEDEDKEIKDRKKKKNGYN